MVVTLDARLRVWHLVPRCSPYPARLGVTTAAGAIKICRAGGREMPAFDEDDKPKKKLVHELGQDLTLLSATELTDRIMLLKDEIARLEADMAKKQAVKSAADTFFKK